MKAQTVCTVSRAKRILAGVWSCTCLYCTLWLFLVDIQVRPSLPFVCALSRALRSRFDPGQIKAGTEPDQRVLLRSARAATCSAATG